MVVAFFISLGLVMLLCIPLVTATFAKRMGRSPEKWFIIGILLPVIAIFILFFIEDRTGKNSDTKS